MSVTVTPAGTSDCGEILAAETSFAYPSGVPRGTPDGTTLALGPSVGPGVRVDGWPVFDLEWLEMGEEGGWGAEFPQAPARRRSEMGRARTARTQ